VISRNHGIIIDVVHDDVAGPSGRRGGAIKQALLRFFGAALIKLRQAAWPRAAAALAAPDSKPMLQAI